MQPDNQEPEAQPEMPEVSRTGDSRSLSGLRRERMEPTNESRLRDLQWNGVSTTEVIAGAAKLFNDPELDELGQEFPDIYPTRFKYYFAAVAGGMVMGITWTIAATTPTVLRHISKDHVLMILYGMAGALAAYQFGLLWLWGRRIKSQRAEIKRRMEILNRKFPMPERFE